MVLRRILDTSTDPVVRVERCKLMASGCQLVAIGVLVAAIVAPTFNPTLHPGFGSRVEGGLAFAFIELLALWILGYLAPKASNED